MNRRIVMISSEAAPFAKAGGLADAVAELAISLKTRGHDVRVVLPRYYFIRRGELERLPIDIPLGHDGEIPLYQTQIGRRGASVPVYLVDDESAFGRDGIYTDETGTPFSDNARRFSLLTRAALEVSRKLAFRPEVFHAHDWPAALTAAYLQQAPYDRWFSESAVVFTIHNLGYQGTFPFTDAAHLRLTPDTMLSCGLVEEDHLNFLRSGLTSSHALTTVSPTYAREISQTENAFGLREVIRSHSRGVTGVLNGIDYNPWDPSSDEHIPFHFDSETLERKRLLARVLRWYLGLPQDDEVPIIGMVTRLVEQKGLLELTSGTNPALLRLLSTHKVHVAILGSGSRSVEARLKEFEAAFDTLAVNLGYDNRLAHLIEAASDFFLMPSRYEPCGLNQMYSMRYGTIPIVTRTGGLADTVTDIRENGSRGTGYLIPECSSRAVYETVTTALRDFEKKPDMIHTARINGMKERFGWDRAAAEYEAVYEEVLSAPAQAPAQAPASAGDRQTSG